MVDSVYLLPLTEMNVYTVSFVKATKNKVLSFSTCTYSISKYLVFILSTEVGSLSNSLK